MDTILTSQITDLKIVGSTNPGIYRKISQESTYNMYESDGCLVPYPGYKSIYNGFAVDTQNRAFFTSNVGNFILVVNANKVYRTNSMTTIDFVEVGTIATNTGSVYIVENGVSEVVLDDGASLYIYDWNADTFNPQDAGVSPLTVSESQGFVFVAANNSNTLVYSAVNDATNYPLQSAFNLGSDRIIAIINVNDYIFVLGETVTKGLRNLGTLLTPFKLDQSVVYKVGCASLDSVDQNFDILVFLGQIKKGNYSIYASDGGSKPVAISTDGIDKIINDLLNPAACSGFLWKNDGHIFYQLTFYEDNLTLVYDFKNQKFYYATSENDKHHHIAKDIIIFGNKYYFTSFDDSKIYQMGDEFTSYDDKKIPRIRITPPFRNPSFDFIKFKRIEIVAEQGIGQNNPESTEMFIDISYSDNSGQTYQMANRMSMAPTGKYEWTNRIFNIGASRERYFMYRFVGLSRFVILGGVLEIE